MISIFKLLTVFIPIITGMKCGGYIEWRDCDDDDLDKWAAFLKHPQNKLQEFIDNEKATFVNPEFMIPNETYPDLTEGEVNQNWDIVFNEKPSQCRTGVVAGIKWNFRFAHDKINVVVWDQQWTNTLEVVEVFFTRMPAAEDFFALIKPFLSKQICGGYTDWRDCNDDDLDKWAAFLKNPQNRLKEFIDNKSATFVNPEIVIPNDLPKLYFDLTEEEVNQNWEIVFNEKPTQCRTQVNSGTKWNFRFAHGSINVEVWDQPWLNTLLVLDVIFTRIPAPDDFFVKN